MKYDIYKIEVKTLLTMASTFLSPLVCDTGNSFYLSSAFQTNRPIVRLLLEDRGLTVKKADAFPDIREQEIRNATITFTSKNNVLLIRFFLQGLQWKGDENINEVFSQTSADSTGIAKFAQIQPNILIGIRATNFIALGIQTLFDETISSIKDNTYPVTFMLNIEVAQGLQLDIIIPIPRIESIDELEFFDIRGRIIFGEFYII